MKSRNHNSSIILAVQQFKSTVVDKTDKIQTFMATLKEKLNYFLSENLKRNTFL